MDWLSLKESVWVRVKEKKWVYFKRFNCSSSSILQDTRKKGKGESERRKVTSVCLVTSTGWTSVYESIFHPVSCCKLEVESICAIFGANKVRTLLGREQLFALTTEDGGWGLLVLSNPTSEKTPTRTSTAQAAKPVWIFLLARRITTILL